MIKRLKHIIRQSKLTYVFYNVMHRQQLQHNTPLYKKYGIRKKYFSPISSKDLPSDLNSDNAVNVSNLEVLFYKYDWPKDLKDSLRGFDENGYAILRNFFNSKTIDAINDEIAQLLELGKLKLRYANRKIMFSHCHSEQVHKIGHDSALLDILSTLFDGTPILYQSINFPFKGSEQRIHSDSVHLTTYPKGGMLGVWIALEKIDDDNGPITYMPGTHKLPYLMNSAYDNEGSFLSLGSHDYSAYEDMVEEEISKNKYPEKIFHAAPGDVLIWHANLLHGGLAHKDDQRTRKSLVMHYFKNECIWYHELSQRPALYPPKIN